MARKSSVLCSAEKLMERNKTSPQTCAVCGEAATGYHYQAPSCIPCKAFFRRTVLKMKVMRCSKEGRCLQPEWSGAKLCRACRFHRCVVGGMNPLCLDAGVAPDDNPVIQEVLRLRADLHCSSTPSPSSDTSVMSLDMSPKSPEVLMNRLIDELVFLEFAHEKIRRSCFAPVPEDGIALAELIRGHSKFAVDYGDMPSAATERPPDPRAEADALWSCVKPKSESCDPTPSKTVSCLKNNRKVWPHADLVYAIEYLKTFEFFHRLTEDEKILLVRWVVAICAHVTGSYFSNKMKSNVTFHPDGSTMSQKCIASSLRIREFHFESIERIRDLEMNEKEYVLLKAIIVCDPTIDGLSAYSCKILDEQRTRYAKSLFSYLSAKRGPHNAPGRFLEMLKLIDWFRGVNERRKENHLLRVAAGLRPTPCGTEERKAKPVLQDEIFL